MLQSISKFFCWTKPPPQVGRVHLTSLDGKYSNIYYFTEEQSARVEQKLLLMMKPLPNFNRMTTDQVSTYVKDLPRQFKCHIETNINEVGRTGHSTVSLHIPEGEFHEMIKLCEALIEENPPPRRHSSSASSPKLSS